MSVSGVLSVTRTSGMDYRNAPPHAFLYFEGTGDKTGSFTAKALKKTGKATSCGMAVVAWVPLILASSARGLN